MPMVLDVNELELVLLKAIPYEPLFVEVTMLPVTVWFLPVLNARPVEFLPRRVTVLFMITTLFAEVVLKEE